MDPTPPTLDHLLERFVRWAEGSPDIRAAFIVGSQARVDTPADEWSDLDLVIIATDPERYLSTTDWLEPIGRPCITFVERNMAGGQERRVLFEGARDIDFNFFSVEKFQQILQDVAAVPVVLRRGVRVLLDRDGLTASFPPVTADVPPARPPEPDQFQEVVNDFWYHAVWTAKKLRRGEHYTARSCSDGYMRHLLRQMIEWHARATHGWDHDTWHEGRFLERWADPRALAGLRSASSHYDAEDICRALFASMDLFRWLAVETADHLGYSYAATADERATVWVNSFLAEKLP